MPATLAVGRAIYAPYNRQSGGGEGSGGQGAGFADDLEHPGPPQDEVFVGKSERAKAGGKELVVTVAVACPIQLAGVADAAVELVDGVRSAVEEVDPTNPLFAAGVDLLLRKLHPRGRQ